MPIIMGETELALKAAEGLWQRGFLIPAIREPSVPKGRARLRVSLMSSHTQQDVDDLVEALAEIGAELGCAGS